MKGLIPEMTLLCERTMYARKTNILRQKFDTIVTRPVRGGDTEFMLEPTNSWLHYFMVFLLTLAKLEE
jgi:hypothetical protein